MLWNYLGGGSFTNGPFTNDPFTNGPFTNEYQLLSYSQNSAARWTSPLVSTRCQIKTIIVVMESVD